MTSHGNSQSSSPDADDTETNSELDQMEIEDATEKEERTSELPHKPSPFEYAIVILRRASSDTEKFAALLVVTKLIKAEELDDTDKKKLLDAVGLQFLARLLQTVEVPEGCHPSMYKSIALTILTCFISSCIGNLTLYGLIPVFSEIIAKAEMYENDISLIKDTCYCLKIIASEKGGRRAIIDSEAIGTLVDACITKSIYCEDALEILLLVFTKEGAQTWEDGREGFTKLLNLVTHEFAVDHGEKKFKLCDFLSEMLQSLPVPLVEIGQPEWKQNLHKGLSDIIFSKLSHELRNKGLRLAGVAMESLGVTWILQVETGASVESKGRQLLLMLVHLASIEVRMSLECKSLEEAVVHAHPTTSCYTILEIAIIFLVNGAIDFEQKQKQQLYTALKGAFKGVLTFLNCASLEDTFFDDSKKHLFISATIRVLGAWLAEETAANKKEVHQTLPFIIKICKYNFEYNKNSMIKSKKKGQTKLYHNEVSLDRLPDILRFLLPGFCHLTAEDIPRHILLEEGLEDLLFEYLNYQWNNIKGVFSLQNKEESEFFLDQIHFACESMETINNILMNVVVQEPERVKTDMFYYSLLKFIFTKVPDIPFEVSYLKLCGSLSTLGLMILHHQCANVKSSDFTIFRFVQTTVRFLWDAHNVEESRDYATLVVSSRYEFHWGNLMDVWFLGMHTLSLLLPIIPWFCDFLIESEWPQTIIMTLMSVREGGLDAGLKSAFEDFLCHLAKSSKPAYNTLKEKGVEQVCRNHKLEELSKVFNVTIIQ